MQFTAEDWYEWNQRMSVNTQINCYRNKPSANIDWFLEFREKEKAVHEYSQNAMQFIQKTNLYLAIKKVFKCDLKMDLINYQSIDYPPSNSILEKFVFSLQLTKKFGYRKYIFVQFPVFLSCSNIQRLLGNINYRISEFDASHMQLQFFAVQQSIHFAITHDIRVKNVVRLQFRSQYILCITNSSSNDPPNARFLNEICIRFFNERQTHWRLLDANVKYFKDADGQWPELQNNSLILCSFQCMHSQSSAETLLQFHGLIRNMNNVFMTDIYFRDLKKSYTVKYVTNQMLDSWKCKMFCYNL